MVHPADAQKARRGLRPIRACLRDLLEMQPCNGRDRSRTCGACQREGHPLPRLRACDPRGDITVLERIDAAHHLVEARDGIGTAAREAPPDGRDPVQNGDMSIIPGAARAGSVQP